MPSTTLRGIFPEPKPVPRRDFIKENVRSIKHMQGILVDAGVIQPRKPKPAQLAQFKNIPRQIKTRENESGKSFVDLIQLKASNSDIKNTELESTNTKSKIFDEKIVAKITNSNPNTSPTKSNSKSKVKSKPLTKSKLTKKNKVPPQLECKFAESAVQTEREEDLKKLYETGIIKYPTESQPPSRRREKSPNKAKSDQGGQGDHHLHQQLPTSDIVDGLNILGISEEKDFVKENMNNIKPKPVKQTLQKVLSQAPPNYKKGEVPKYLRDRKDYFSEDLDEECPAGHVMLPDDERKETLKVLRKSYAERIQELNMMPVRNDTLKMRRRKMDIEAELDRLDQGIKVFQRPKVYVKMDMLKGS